MVGQVYDIDGLVRAVGKGVKPEYLFFWGHRGSAETPGKHVLSQWFPAQFELDGQRYATAEHFMMAEKARLFGAADILAQVLATDDPKEAKALGRKIKADDWSRWDAASFDAVVRGNVAKFTQNAAMGAWLTSTAPKVLVEASPSDAMWGIGLAAADARAGDPAQWLGKNRLGFALMKVRDHLAPG